MTWRFDFGGPCSHPLAGGPTPQVSVVLSLGCGQAAAAAMTTESQGGVTGLFGRISAAQDMMAGLFNLMTDTDMTHEVKLKLKLKHGTRDGADTGP